MITSCWSTSLRLPGSPKTRGSPTQTRRSARHLSSCRRVVALISLREVVGGVGGTSNDRIGLTTRIPGRGRYIVANEAIPPGEVLISLPHKALICAIGDLEYPNPNAGELAIMILQLRARRDPRYRAWFKSLPTSLQLCLPPVGFCEAELAACGSKSLIAQLKVTTDYLEMIFERLKESGTLLELRATREHFMWAASLALSRSFSWMDGFESLVIAPGIDMCNHSFTPNASYRSHSGDLQWQGSGRGFEVLSRKHNYKPSLTGFDLVAGEAGIRKGEEVTIAYQPVETDEAYYTSYGFLPDDRPSKSMTIFKNTEELNHSLAFLGIPLLFTSIPYSITANAEGLEPQSEKLVLQVLEGCLEGAQTILPPSGDIIAKPLWEQKLWELLLHRCRTRLEEAETVAGWDPPPAKMSDNMKLSVKLRERQCEILSSLVLVCNKKLEVLAHV